MKRMFCVLLSDTMSIQVRCMMQVLFSAFLPHFAIVTTKMHVVLSLLDQAGKMCIFLQSGVIWSKFPVACMFRSEVCLLFCLAAQPPAEFLVGVRVGVLNDSWPYL